MRGHRPQSLGDLCGDPKRARNSERTASISLAVTEKIEYECWRLAPPSDETLRQRGPVTSPFHGGPKCLQSLRAWLISRPPKNLRVEKSKILGGGPLPQILGEWPPNVRGAG